MSLNQIVNAIQKANEYRYIVRVGVFGSYARGEETDKSDIDILIEYDNCSDEFLDDLDNFMEHMEKMLHDKIDYVTLSGLMKSTNEEFRNEVMNEVKWIYNKK